MEKLHPIKNDHLLCLLGPLEYHFGIGKKNHLEAKATCQSIGGKLFEPKSEKVYKEVSTLAKIKGISKFWMGIHDISNEGQFTYDSDGKDVVWTNWHGGEPNDWGKGEDCVRSVRRGNKWNDSPCNDKYSFICEKSGIPSNEFIAICSPNCVQL